MLVNMSGGKVEEITEVVEPVLLWTNARPTSEFAAQTVSLPSGYSGYIVELRVSTSNAGVPNRTFVPNNGGALCAVSFYAESTGNVGSLRNAIGKESAIEFSYGRTTNSVNQNNSQAIPTRIWGVQYTL